MYAENAKGVSIQTFFDQYAKDTGKISTCDTDLKNVKRYDRYEQIDVDQMILPFLFFSACLILAIIFKLGKHLLCFVGYAILVIMHDSVKLTPIQCSSPQGRGDADTWAETS